jgi:hypothetical protein
MIVCTPKRLDPSLRYEAAENAISINQLNRAPVERLIKVLPGITNLRPYISVLTTKRWKTNGVDLSVSFMDSPSKELREKILFHLNAWGDNAAVRFRETNDVGTVRIAREGGEDGGYWSYLGTDVLLIPQEEQTMNLEGFTMETPDSEFFRVVRHEAGHTLGFPHEHMRRDLIDLINKEKAIEYFMATQGWTREEVIAQVLTPIDESSLFGTPRPDPHSIMCYQIPGSLTKNGQPIPGGNDIDQIDREFCAACYPKRNRPLAASADAIIEMQIEVSEKNGIRGYGFSFDGDAVVMSDGKGEFSIPKNQTKFLKWVMIGDPGSTMKVVVSRDGTAKYTREKSPIIAPFSEGRDEFRILES